MNPPSIEACLLEDGHGTEAGWCLCSLTERPPLIKKLCYHLHPTSNDARRCELAMKYKGLVEKFPAMHYMDATSGQMHPDAKST